ncbi:hypothetical protein PsAD37_04039 [Pseudovibrio sp. Ad37]|nr:hypothetical protein PsAD37_04039 [Pseudovibrio sp. Ad37]
MQLHATVFPKFELTQHRPVSKLKTLDVWVIGAPILDGQDIGDVIQGLIWLGWVNQIELQVTRISDNLQVCQCDAVCEAEGVGAGGLCQSILAKAALKDVGVVA